MQQQQQGERQHARWRGVSCPFILQGDGRERQLALGAHEDGRVQEHAQPMAGPPELAQHLLGVIIFRLF